MAIAAPADPPKGEAGRPKLHVLSSKEIEDGWLMLFDGETTFGWKVEGDATVKDGKLVVGGAKDTKLTTTTDFPHSSFRRSMSTDDGQPANGGRILGPDGHVMTDLSQPTTPGAATPTGPIKGGRAVGPITIEVPAGKRVSFSTLAICPGGYKPIFDGKSLTGWRVFEGDAKRVKSKFDVTPNGELHAVNGPGDLQTTAEYADFFARFECKTNGKLLNSGLFFRCLAGQYQNGYEAQIQNGYLGERTIPVDYGTGAIYRRVKARKVVSDDNEWFGMTVAARGKHIATWVNGYQTVDWTDDRPADENARKGSKTGKGHLSIQGHDPTTDILFRNVQIADLTEEKE